MCDLGMGMRFVYIISKSQLIVVNNEIENFTYKTKHINYDDFS